MFYVWEIDHADHVRVWSAQNADEYLRVAAMTPASQILGLDATADMGRHFKAGESYNKNYGVCQGADAAMLAIAKLQCPAPAADKLYELVLRHITVARKREASAAPGIHP